MTRKAPKHDLTSANNQPLSAKIEFNSEGNKSTNEAFSNLVEHILQFDPINLLCHLMIKNLLVEPGEFIGEENEINQWVVRLELISGILLAREYPPDTKHTVAEPDLIKLDQLLTEYETSILRDLRSGEFLLNKKEGIGAGNVLMSVRNYSYWVRGNAYIHQYFEIAHAIYSPHDAWFKTNLGFTISDVIILIRSFIEEYDRRINTEEVAAHEYSAGLTKNVGSSHDSKLHREHNLSCQLNLERVHECLALSVEDLSQLAKLPAKTCSNILDRLSQKFGYRNAKFPAAYSDAHSAPWDFNTLYERPFVHHGQHYWMLLPTIVPSVAMSTFYFDLMNDEAYRPQFEKNRGKWLEEKTAQCFKKIFHEREVFLNPTYPNGDEMADVLVLHDHKVLIIQCKSKGLTFEASKGQDLNKLRTDLSKAVGRAFDQGKNARKNLIESPQSVLYCKENDLEIKIDNTQTDQIFIVVVTANHLQHLPTKWDQINSELRLFSNKDYPWVLSVVDLDVISEILSEPAQFIHYITRRIGIEQSDQKIFGDELDLLGMYLNQGLYYQTKEYEKVDLIGLLGMSRDIDEYMFRKYALGEHVEKPSGSEPKEFTDLIAAISRLDIPHRSDIALAILDLSGNTRMNLMAHISQAKERTMLDGEVHTFSMKIEENGGIILFLSMDAGGTEEILNARIKSLVQWKYQHKHDTEFFGFGWDKSTRKIVDTALYALFQELDSPK